MRVYVEAALDFPEEEIDFLVDEKVIIRLKAIKDQLADITAKATQGSLLRNGLNLVIIGEPNAGKSSLLNVLSGMTQLSLQTLQVLPETFCMNR